MKAYDVLITIGRKTYTVVYFGTSAGMAHDVAAWDYPMAETIAVMPHYMKEG